MAGWDIILHRYVEYLIYEKGHSPEKVRTYEKLFKYTLIPVLPYPFSLDETRRLLIDQKKAGRSCGYMNHIITALNSFVRYCQLEKEPQEDFSALLNKLRPKEDRTPDPNDLLSVEEVKSILSAPRAKLSRNSNKYGWGVDYYNDVHDRYSLLFELIYKCAARSGECVKLKKKDFAFQNHSLTFYDTKTKNDRTVAIPPDMEDRMKEFVSKLSDTEFLFRATTNGKSQHISQEMVNRMFKLRCKNIGIERSVHIHMLRHSCITHMLLAGAGISIVQAICGHRRLSTTQLYTHILTDNQRQAMFLYNPLIRDNLDFKMLTTKVEEFVKSLALDGNDKITYVIQKTNEHISFEIIRATNDCVLQGR